jgi:hypothetical protein
LLESDKQVVGPVLLINQLLMWFWPVNEMTEPVSDMPTPQLGTNLRECEDQSWFKVQDVHVTRFD